MPTIQANGYPGYSIDSYNFKPLKSIPGIVVGDEKQGEKRDPVIIVPFKLRKMLTLFIKAGAQLCGNDDSFVDRYRLIGAGN
jgi:hypothetical protein